MFIYVTNPNDELYKVVDVLLSRYSGLRSLGKTEKVALLQQAIETYSGDLIAL